MLKKLTLHVDVEVEADTSNIAKAIVEARAQKLACVETSDTLGDFSVKVISARAADVKGPRQEKAASKQPELGTGTGRSPDEETD